MKKNLRKIISLVLVLAMALAVSIPAFAAESVQKKTISTPVTTLATVIQSTHNVLSPQYVPCPGGGKHTMAGRGTGIAYRGAYPSDDMEIYGFCSQCTKCKEFFITEYNPFWAGVTQLGEYTMGQVNYDLSNTMNVYYTNDFWYNDSIAQDESLRGYVW